MENTSAVGVCHICQRTRAVTYCGACDHWFCETCKSSYFARGIEWVKQLIGGKRAGCCGPEKTA